VPFNEGETVKVRNTYRVKTTHDSMGYTYMGYVLKTGAMWKDKIGYAKVEFRLGSIKPYELTDLSPLTMRFRDGALVFERKDFEPQYDLSVIYNKFMYTDDYPYAADSTIKKQLTANISRFQEIDRLVKEGLTQELKSIYRELQKQKLNDLDYIERGNARVQTAYIASFLPAGELPQQILSVDSISISDGGDGRFAIECTATGNDLVERELQVSHVENGKKVVDVSIDSSEVIMSFSRDVEYEIGYTIKDSIDRIAAMSRTYKYPYSNEEPKVTVIEAPPAPEPEPSTRESGSNAGVSAEAAGTDNLTDDTNTIAESEGDAANAVQKPGEDSSGRTSRIIKIVVLAVIIIVVVAYLVYRKMNLLKR
jgi:hypothetical protein